MAGDGQTNPHIEIPELFNPLPRCDWVYFATTAKWSGTVTADFVTEHRVIVRSVYNTLHQRIANVQHLMPGQRILLGDVGPGKPARALLIATRCGAAGR